MRYLSISEVFELHDRIISSSGGSLGLRDLNALESAVNLPRQTFDQKDLYPDIVTKAAALCFSLVMNHPFIDGNKRVGHAAFIILCRSKFIAFSECAAILHPAGEAQRCAPE